MRLLLIEDDQITKNTIYSHLFNEYYIVDQLPTNLFSNRIFHNDFFDALIINVDVLLRNSSIKLNTIRKVSNQTPILVLGEQAQKKICIEALDYGADAYMLKPYHMGEMSALLRSLIRRNSNLPPKRITITNQITFIPENYSLNKDGHIIFLGKKPARILSALLANQGQILSKSYLTRTVYGPNNNIKSNVIEAHMHGLRKAIGKGIISSIKDEGYTIQKTIK